MTTSNDSNATLDTNLSAIDAAIAKANARKAAKLAAQGANGDVVTSVKAPKEKKAKEPKPVDEEKATREAEKEAKKLERQAAQEAERTLREQAREEKKLQRALEREESMKKLEARRAERALTREAKKAAQLAERAGKKAHMGKVEKAAAKLPALTQEGTSTVNEITANFTAAQVAAIALHLQHFNRVQATERALSAKPKVGQTVTITGGDPRFIGKVGTLSKVQRIRAFVNVPELNRDVYVFTSDVVATEASGEELTGTES